MLLSVCRYIVSQVCLLSVTSNTLLSMLATRRGEESRCASVLRPPLYPVAPAMSVLGLQMGKPKPGVHGGAHPRSGVAPLPGLCGSYLYVPSDLSLLVRFKHNPVAVATTNVCNNLMYRPGSKSVNA